MLAEIRKENNDVIILGYLPPSGTDELTENEVEAERKTTKLLKRRNLGIKSDFQIREWEDVKLSLGFLAPTWY
jgi:hypothetical protein